MSLLRRLRGSSLLMRFGVISLVLTIAVGLVLSSVLSTAIEDRARQQSEDAALMAVRLGLQPQITRVDLAHGFDAERLARVEKAVDAAAEEFGTDGHALAAFDPVELKIYGADRTILYHSEHPELVGDTSGSGELGAALVGFSPTLSAALLGWAGGEPWLVAGWMVLACAVSLVAFLASEETRDLDIGLEKPDQDALVSTPKVAKEEQTPASVGS